MEALDIYTKPWIEAADFENRESPRFDIHLPIEYRTFKSFITHIGNISENGLLIYFPVETIVPPLLSLRLFFTSGTKLDTIKIRAEVVWRDNRLGKGDPNYYPHGVRFVNISTEDRSKLRKFLRTLSCPLDDVQYRFDNLRVIFWIRTFMNGHRGIF